nr:ABC transporter substrate-binding protein [Caenimonas soli]
MIAQRTKDAVDSALAGEPDMLVVLAPGSMGTDIVNVVRAKRGSGIAIYMLSIISGDDLLRGAGLANSLGVVISQALPFPGNINMAIMRAYMADLKKYAPEATPAYTSLEGYIGARVLYEALRKAGAKPTRQDVLAKLNALGKLDVGDLQVNYSRDQKAGNKAVDITMVSRGGKLIR